LVKRDRNHNNWYLMNKERGNAERTNDEEGEGIRVQKGAGKSLVGQLKKDLAIVGRYSIQIYRSWELGEDTGGEGAK